MHFNKCKILNLIKTYLPFNRHSFLLNLKLLISYPGSIYKSAILKLNPDDSQAWLVSYSLSPSMKSLAVDSSENFVYFASWTAPINIFKLQGVDGVLNAVYSW